MVSLLLFLRYDSGWIASNLIIGVPLLVEIVICRVHWLISESFYVISYPVTGDCMHRDKLLMKLLDGRLNILEIFPLIGLIRRA